MAKAESTSTEIAIFSPEQLAQEAAAIANSISVGGDKISVKDGVFTLPDGRTSETMDAVIVDFAFINEMYEGRYDPKKPASAVCAAFGVVEQGMVPYAHSPKLQAQKCAVCPNNQYGSAGTGKACKNTIALVLAAPGTDGEQELYTLRLSPTATTPFKKYIKSTAATMALPLYGVVTHFEFDPNETYPKVLCSNKERVRNPDLNGTIARRQEASARLQQMVSFAS